MYLRTSLVAFMTPLRRSTPHRGCCLYPHEQKPGPSMTLQAGVRFFDQTHQGTNLRTAKKGIAIGILESALTGHLILAICCFPD